jgi:hypothetical protein
MGDTRSVRPLVKKRGWRQRAGKAKTEKEVRGEFGSEHPVNSCVQHTFYIGNLKGAAVMIVLGSLHASPEWPAIWQRISGQNFQKMVRLPALLLRSLA